MECSSPGSGRKALGDDSDDDEAEKAKRESRDTMALRINVNSNLEQN